MGVLSIEFLRVLKYLRNLKISFGFIEMLDVESSGILKQIPKISD